MFWKKKEKKEYKIIAEIEVISLFAELIKILEKKDGSLKELFKDKNNDDIFYKYYPRHGLIIVEEKIKE